MSDPRTCNCPIIMIALAFLIAATAIATGAIYGWLTGGLVYVGLWLAVFVVLVFRVAALDRPEDVGGGATVEGYLETADGGPGSGGDASVVGESGVSVTASCLGTRARRTLKQRARVAAENEGPSSTAPELQHSIGRKVASSPADEGMAHRGGRGEDGPAGTVVIGQVP